MPAGPRSRACSRRVTSAPAGTGVRGRAIVAFADGSVQQVSSYDLRKVFLETEDPGKPVGAYTTFNWILFP